MQLLRITITVRIFILILLAGYSNILSAQVIPDTDVPPAPTRSELPIQLYGPAYIGYIRTKVFSAPVPYYDSIRIQSDTLSVSVAQESTRYFDGMGRNTQTVMRQQTPSGKDLVSQTRYDASVNV